MQYAEWKLSVEPRSEMNSGSKGSNGGMINTRKIKNQTQKSPTMTDLYEVIKHITNQKIQKRIHPTHALETDVKKLYTGDSFKQEIETLLSVGLITAGRTINHNYYKITEI